MRPVIQSRTLVFADANGIFQDQQTGGAGNLTLNGFFVTGGVAFLDFQRQVELESVGNLSAVNFTITGTDEQGREISETIAGPNAGTVATQLDFFTVTQIAVDAAVGTDVEGGTNTVGGSIPVPVDQYLTPTNIGIALVISGTVDVTVQHSFDDPFEADLSIIPTWHSTDPGGDLENATATVDGNVVIPPRMLRLLNNSGSGLTVMTIVQAGAVA